MYSRPSAVLHARLLIWRITSHTRICCEGFPVTTVIYGPGVVTTMRQASPIAKSVRHDEMDKMIITKNT